MPWTSIVYASTATAPNPNNAKVWSGAPAAASAAGAPNAATTQCSIATAGNVSDGIEFTYPPISIPGGNPPLGLRWTIRARYSGASSPDYQIDILRAAAASGVSPATVNTVGLTDFQLGSAASLFGFTAGDIAAGLVCQMIGTCINSVGLATLRVDAMGLEVWYQSSAVRNRRRSWRRRTRRRGS